MHMDTFVFLTSFGFVSVSIGGISSHGLYLPTTLIMWMIVSILKKNKKGLSWRKTQKPPWCSAF